MVLPQLNYNLIFENLRELNGPSPYNYRALSNYIEHQYQDVEVPLKALHRNSHHPRHAMETEAKAPGFPP